MHHGERNTTLQRKGIQFKMRWRRAEIESVEAKVGFLRATCSSPLMLIHVDQLAVEKKERCLAAWDIHKVFEQGRQWVRKFYHAAGKFPRAKEPGELQSMEAERFRWLSGWALNDPAHALSWGMFSCALEKTEHFSRGYSVI